MRFPSSISRIVIPLILLLAANLPGFAQDGKLKIHTSPKQAYVFVDNHAMGEASRHTYRVSPGDHRVDLYNYGYKTATQNVSITAGQTTTVTVTLEPIAGEVPGPRGCITIEGADRNAVLLNGRTPEYFVGHGDEFNNEWLWKQELIVPPGTHQLTVIGADKEIWSGTVEVPTNRRVVVDVPKGVRKTVPWPHGERIASLARFKAGIASAAVVVSKPTAQLSATAAQVDCGDTAQLKWTSADAVHVDISTIGAVTASGEQAVHPKQSTTYLLTASGPGGTATSSATVAPNPLQATLAASPAEIRYKRVGDQVVEQGSATLNWTTSSASEVSIQPLGSVPATGNRVVQVTPRKVDEGPVDETVTYTLNATNPCGAAETRTATVHIIGSIEPGAALGLRSVYFPTDYPKASNRGGGLLASQQRVLMTLAEEFKRYLASHADVRLLLDGHADRRGSQQYNQALSERRADRAKQFLVEQGVPSDKIDTRGDGYQQNLTADQVKQLVEQHPELTETERQQHLQKLRTLVLATNRRVDVSLSTGQEPLRYYPFKAEDFSALLRREATTKSVEMAAIN